MNPRIPDAAFQAVAERADDLHDVTMGTAGTPQEAAEAAHVYARSLGLDGENDQRAYALAQSSLAYLSQGTDHRTTREEVHAAVPGSSSASRSRARRGGSRPSAAEGR